MSLISGLEWSHFTRNKPTIDVLHVLVHSCPTRKCCFFSFFLAQFLMHSLVFRFHFRDSVAASAANSSSYSSCYPTPTRTTRSLFFLYKVNVWHVYKCVQFTYWWPVQWLDQTYHIIKCKCKNNQFKEELEKYSSRSGEYKVRLLNAKPEKELILFVDHNT